MTSSDMTQKWPDLVRQMDVNNGVFSVTMERLRLLEGAQRLGPNVVSAIDDRLKMLGIGHLPVELPNRGDDAVVLYRHGTEASELISAIQQGIKGTVGAATVSALRKINEPPEDAPPIDDIKEKVVNATSSLNDILRQLGAGTVLT